MVDAISSNVRDLAAAVRSDPTRLPLREVVALSAATSRDITIDLTEQPVVAFTRPRRHPALADLTPRELEVATLIAAGYSNRQLADTLFISLATAKDHVHAILVKTGFERRSQIAAAWYGALDHNP